MNSAGVIGGDGGGLGGCGVSTNELTISRMCAIPVLPEFDTRLLEVCDGLSMVNGASVAVAITAPQTMHPLAHMKHRKSRSSGEQPLG